MKTTARSLALLGIALICLSAAEAQAQRRHLAPQAVVNVLSNNGNYVTFGGQKCLKWETGGVALSSVEPGVGHWAETYKLDKKTNGTIAKDGAKNECVAFVRMCTNAPGSAKWKKGPPVLFSSGIQNRVSPGTLLARFNSNDKYTDQHCVIFAGFRSDGGISVWDQNVSGRTIKWRAIPATGKGGVGDAKSYYVVETD